MKDDQGNELSIRDEFQWKPRLLGGRFRWLCRVTVLQVKIGDEWQDRQFLTYGERFEFMVNAWVEWSKALDFSKFSAGIMRAAELAKTVADTIKRVESDMQQGQVLQITDHGSPITAPDVPRAEHSFTFL